MKVLNKPDGLILDMDGTLWDNVDTYAKAWTAGLEKCGYNKIITRDDIIGLMGKEARIMLNVLLPEWNEEKKNSLFTAVIESYKELVPVMKPHIYDGVLEGLTLLSENYKLFLLSNCEKDGLIRFMNYTKTNHLFTDFMEHGMNLMPKHYNIQLLVDKHNLQSPIYVGDTDSDSIESSKVNVPFVFMTYVFGHTENYYLKFESFDDLVQYYLNLANNHK